VRPTEPDQHASEALPALVTVADLLNSAHALVREATLRALGE